MAQAARGNRANVSHFLSGWSWARDLGLGLSWGVRCDSVRVEEVGSSH